MQRTQWNIVSAAAVKKLHWCLSLRPKIISHALLRPLLTSTCFHRQMLMLLLRVITRHQTALQKKNRRVTLPLIASVWDFEHLMTVTKPGVTRSWRCKHFYRIWRPWSDFTVTGSHTTIFFSNIFLSFIFYFSLIVPPLSLPPSSALPRTLSLSSKPSC